MADTDLAKVTPPADLSYEERTILFEHIFRRLAAHRNTSERWEGQEYAACEESGDGSKNEFVNEMNEWANELAENAWVACGEPGKKCPCVDSMADTSTRGLPCLPPQEALARILNTILVLQVTSLKQYSAHTRTFLFSFATLDEAAVATTLKDPKRIIAQAEAQTHAKDVQAAQVEANKTWRRVGMGGAALAGGVLVGVTGGLAAPLVGAGISTLFGALGMGGTVAGILAGGLAGSSAVCGALFGAYGAKSSAEMVERHTKDVADFDVLPVREPKETLAVRICVSGWVDDKSDVTAPWTVYDDSQDTYALQFEIDALRKLSNALGDLIKSHAMKYIKSEIIKRTFLAALFASLSPIAWLKLGQIIDNPWANARALALKTGKVLGILLAARAFGTRPITLTGYSLGSLVILTALQHLASLPPAQTAHLVQDVFLLGTPAPTDTATWARARRIVAGRLVNAYTGAEEDYVLAVLSRVSVGAVTMGEFGVAGLQPVEVAGVENVHCEGVEGHVGWRGMVGRCLEKCGVKDVKEAEVEKQEKTIGEKIKKEIEAVQYDFSPDEPAQLVSSDVA